MEGGVPSFAKNEAQVFSSDYPRRVSVMARWPEWEGLEVPSDPKSSCCMAAKAKNASASACREVVVVAVLVVVTAGCGALPLVDRMSPFDTPDESNDSPTATTVPVLRAVAPERMFPPAPGLGLLMISSSCRRSAR